MSDSRPAPSNRTALTWVAQGFGVGRARLAPGTWGSLLGIPLILALLTLPTPAAYLLVTLALTAAAIPICTIAEEQLGQTDPGSVVLDEIIALPWAFSGYALHWWMAGASPGLDQLQAWWPALLAAFVVFRVLDIWKPWPIRSLQHLPRGWGIVLDDVAAGIGTAVVLWLGTTALFYARLAG